jgi:hypothetical protein
MARRVSLVQELSDADVVVYGHLANPKLDVKTLNGTTEFHFDKVLKDDPKFPRQKMVTLASYLPVIDAKNAPRYVMFFRAPAKNNQPYNGRQLSSPAVLEFAVGVMSHRDYPVEQLRFAGKHLDHADPQIAEEAFLLFAKADDKLIGQVAKQMQPAVLRKLVKTPDMEPERLSMFAYLLGACGNADDVELMRGLLKNPAPRYFRAYEGILAGYITLQPKEGWAFALDTLKDQKNSFVLRYAVLRTMRFFYNAHPGETGDMVLQGESLALTNSDIADVAIQDLIRWKRWEHTKLVVACYDKASHQSPIVKNSIVRYALTCPDAEARALVERVRREDPKTLKYLEEELK